MRFREIKEAAVIVLNNGMVAQVASKRVEAEINVIDVVDSDGVIHTVTPKDVKQNADADVAANFYDLKNSAKTDAVTASDATVLQNLSKPSLHFQGTVKLHGTNAAVVADRHGDLWSQSRENILSVEKDNSGFASFVHGHTDEFRDLLSTAVGVYGAQKAYDAPYICVYGEWCGNIQSGVTITGFPKMFVIIGIAFADEESNKTYFTKEQIKDVVDGCREYIGVTHAIKSIWDFPTFDITIDFERSELSQKEISSFVFVKSKKQQ